MLKVEDNKINIYSKINKDSLGLSMFLFGFAMLVIIFVSLIAQNIIFLALEIFPLFFLLVSIYFYSKKDGEELKYSLSKEEFIIYKNKSEIKYNCSDIINFSAIDYNNAVSINYTNEKNKKCSKVIELRGCKNLEFVNLANEFLKKDINLNVENNKINTDVESDSKDVEQIFKDLEKSDKKIKCDLLGKSKMFILNGNSYTLEKFDSCLFFVTEDNKLLEIDLRDIDINWDELNFKNKYELSYNKQKHLFSALKLDESVNLENINNFKNNIKYSTKLSFDEQEILKEVELYNKILKLNNVMKILILLSLLSLFFSMLVFSLAFCIILILYPCMLLTYVSKYKKNSSKNM